MPQTNLASDQLLKTCRATRPPRSLTFFLLGARQLRASIVNSARRRSRPLNIIGKNLRVPALPVHLGSGRRVFTSRAATFGGFRSDRRSGGGTIAIAKLPV
ncbi:hypothetical protein AAFF_G00263190 [Aldrovandia affinis]|uniref:Uncharacterized protein n=1 Tax=Aldrovandia affinis TaxID=143900 RepID=A0AAD7SSW9_9TELE|nr:hypothetical protein AAFF_G00263190 [Aldrovandia affinis]